MDGSLCGGLYAVLILFDMNRKKLFDMKDFNCNYNLIYSTSFR